MAVGFRVFSGGAKVDIDAVNRFRKLPVANVSDAMNRMSAGGTMLRPMHAGGVLAGAAVTVKTRPGDNLMMHKAFDIAEPGDVIVVDAGGDVTNAIIGENAAASSADGTLKKLKPTDEEVSQAKHKQENGIFSRRPFFRYGRGLKFVGF
jgi:hypothetical protein